MCVAKMHAVLVIALPLHFLPSFQVQVEVLSVQRNEQEIQKGFCGDNLKVKLKGIEEDEISSGFILCDPDNFCHVGRVFDAQVECVE